MNTLTLGLPSGSFLLLCGILVLEALACAWTLWTPRKRRRREVPPQRVSNIQPHYEGRQEQ